MTSEHIKNIDRLGYTVIPQVYNSGLIASALKTVKYWEKNNPATTEGVPYLNQNQPNIYNLQNKDMLFLRMLFKSEEVQRILIYFLNDIWYRQIAWDLPNYILRAFQARSSAGALPLHIDSFIPYKDGPVIAMQMAIMLEDSSVNNGCTIVVPGSHKSGMYALNIEDLQIEPIPIIAKAGDIVIWDSRTWHGTTENISGGTRWSLVATFCRWWIKQSFDIPSALPGKIYDKLSEKERSILGFCSRPYLDESMGIDMKKGYMSE